MKTVLRGVLEGLLAVARARVEEGMLVFDLKGELSLTLDTAFEGAIAVPDEVLEELDTKPMGEVDYELAGGQVITLPAYLGRVRVGRDIVMTEFWRGRPCGRGLHGSGRL